MSVICRIKTVAGFYESKMGEKPSELTLKQFVEQELEQMSKSSAICIDDKVYVPWHAINEMTFLEEE